MNSRQYPTQGPWERQLAVRVEEQMAFRRAKEREMGVYEVAMEKDIREQRTNEYQKYNQNHTKIEYSKKTNSRKPESNILDGSTFYVICGMEALAIGIMIGYMFRN